MIVFTGHCSPTAVDISITKESSTDFEVLFDRIHLQLLTYSRSCLFLFKPLLANKGLSLARLICQHKSLSLPSLDLSSLIPWAAE